MARRPASPTPSSGVYLGVVVRVTGDTCYVELPDIAKGSEYGPARHPGAVARGDGVAVAFLAGKPDDVVVLALLA